MTTENENHPDVAGNPEPLSETIEPEPKNVNETGTPVGNGPTFCPSCRTLLRRPTPGEVLCPKCGYHTIFNQILYQKHQERLFFENMEEKRKKAEEKKRRQEREGGLESIFKAHYRPTVESIVEDFQGIAHHKSQIYSEFEDRVEMEDWHFEKNDQGRVRYQHCIDGILTSLKKKGLTNNDGYGHWWATQQLMDGDY